MAWGVAAGGGMGAWHGARGYGGLYYQQAELGWDSDAPSSSSAATPRRPMSDIGTDDLSALAAYGEMHGDDGESFYEGEDGGPDLDDNAASSDGVDDLGEASDGSSSEGGRGARADAHDTGSVQSEPVGGGMDDGEEDSHDGDSNDDGDGDCDGDGGEEEGEVRGLVQYGDEADGHGSRCGVCHTHRAHRTHGSANCASCASPLAAVGQPALPC